MQHDEIDEPFTQFPRTIFSNIIVRENEVFINSIIIIITIIAFDLPFGIQKYLATDFIVQVKQPYDEGR